MGRAFTQYSIVFIIEQKQEHQIVVFLAGLLLFLLRVLTRVGLTKATLVTFQCHVLLPCSSRTVHTERR
jgi:hypothetical protein